MAGPAGPPTTALIKGKKIKVGILDIALLT